MRLSLTAAADACASLTTVVRGSATAGCGSSADGAAGVSAVSADTGAGNSMSSIATISAAMAWSSGRPSMITERVLVSTSRALAGTTRLRAFLTDSGSA
ncbi:MAG: hypothetical protein BWY85_01972 [Firmicutes bacterium ADurb.Bin506]|nr:MAG: hypothetical protein BWY85_01972 [Firmicutes bacterium ADurb.Bin506]